MRKGIRIAGIAVFFLACFLEWQAIHLRYYTDLGPGPGFFAVWLAGILALLAVGVAVTSSLATNLPIPEDFWPTRNGYFRMAVVILALSWMAYFMNRLGYRITSFMFLAVLGYIFGLRNFLLLVCAAVIGSFGIFYLFNNLLSTPLPEGIFGF
jgi:putative tricarboxylic transport membrane protein